jgi:CHAD domain-containing protein
LIRRPRFAAAISAVQAILGDHQDTVMAGAWLRATGAAVSQACIAAGELIAAERQERARLPGLLMWPRGRAASLAL